MSEPYQVFGFGVLFLSVAATSLRVQSAFSRHRLSSVCTRLSVVRILHPLCHVQWWPGHVSVAELIFLCSCTAAISNLFRLLLSFVIARLRENVRFLRCSHSTHTQSQNNTHTYNYNTFSSAVQRTRSLVHAVRTNNVFNVAIAMPINAPARRTLTLTHSCHTPHSTAHQRTSTRRTPDPDAARPAHRPDATAIHWKLEGRRSLNSLSSVVFQLS